jgi:hypothetical protein
MVTDLLNYLRKSNSTHISNHIHEWRRRRRLIKSAILYQLLEDWFTKSLFPPIAIDLSMGGIVTEERTISGAQYLDLVYSQSNTLYDLIPHVPLPSNNSLRPALESHANSKVGSVTNTKISSPTQTSKVNAVPPLHLNNLEVRRKTRVNPRNLLTSRRVQKLLTPSQKRR